MKLAFLTILFFIAGSASAQNYWIPAERFSQHTDRALEGALAVDEGIGKQVNLLVDGQQVRIKIGLDSSLMRYLEEYSVFEVCALLANYDNGVTNTIRSKHPNPTGNRTHSLRANGFRTLCTEQTSINAGNLQLAGVKVLSPSQSVVKVRGISFRGISGRDEEPVISTGDSSRLGDYEYSRTLGYLWGDGRVSSDGGFLYFLKRNTSISNHFGSVAESYFGNALTENSQGTRYRLTLDGIGSEAFLAEGIRLSNIPDKRAFLTSVIETEGAVIVGRVTDDPSYDRCLYIKTLVDGLNPRCAANTCTDNNCSTPNCAFIARGNKRGTPYRPGVTSHCGVYLSGSASDWRSLFGNDNYHFVKTDRTPGGEPTKYLPSSRPSYTQ